MKKSSKGFTLIELLAIIIILGIIASSAIPIVNNLINNSKSGANSESAYSALQAANYYFSKKIVSSEPMQNPVIFDFSTLNGLEIDGEVPTKGRIYLTVDGVASIVEVLKISDHYCGYENSTSERVICSDKENAVFPRNVLAASLESAYEAGTRKLLEFYSSSEPNDEFIFDVEDANKVNDTNLTGTIPVDGKIKNMDGTIQIIEKLQYGIDDEYYCGYDPEHTTEIKCSVNENDVVIP